MATCINIGLKNFHGWLAVLICPRHWWLPCKANTQGTNNFSACWSCIWQVDRTSYELQIRCFLHHSTLYCLCLPLQVLFLCNTGNLQESITYQSWTVGEFSDASTNFSELTPSIALLLRWLKTFLQPSQHQKLCSINPESGTDLPIDYWWWIPYNIQLNFASPKTFQCTWYHLLKQNKIWNTNTSTYMYNAHAR